jgi:polyphosphate kinase
MATVARQRTTTVATHTGAAAPTSAPALGRYLNRELSTLQFHERVLAQAEDEASPLLERTKFMAIVAGALDEFYQVRVAGLKRQVAAGTLATSPDGLTAAQQLARIDRRARKIAGRHAQLFTEQLRPALADAGIPIVRWSDLDDAARTALGELFHAQIFPVLTPLAVDPPPPVPNNTHP